MQEELSAIIRRFKEHDFYQLCSNKENDHRNQANRKDQTNQIYKQTKQERKLKEMVESLIFDGNRMHDCYEEIIQQISMAMDGLRQEMVHAKTIHEEEKSEANKTIRQLNDKIENLNKQIAAKQDNYHEILQKYEEFVEQANQMHLEGFKQIKELQSDRLTQSAHFEMQMRMSVKQIDETKNLLVSALENNQILLTQNRELKNINQKLMEQNEYLRGKIDQQKFNKFIRLQNRQENQQQSLDSIHHCDLKSISRQSKNYIDAIKMDQQSQVNFAQEKQLLNISEHYSKFNRTQQIQRLKSELDSHHDAQSIVRKYQTTKNALERIDDLFQKNTPIKQSVANEQRLKQNQKEDESYKHHYIDPYHAFFQLLVQCEKLNSTDFMKISHIDIGFLYQELLKNYIPYNLWQIQIKKKLEEKARKK